MQAAFLMNALVLSAHSIVARPHAKLLAKRPSRRSITPREHAAAHGGHALLQGEPLRTGSGFKGIIIHLLTRSGKVQRDLLARGSGRGRVAGGRAAGWQAAGGRLAGDWRATRGSVAWQWAGADCAPGPRSGGARQWRPAISVELSGLCWAGRGRAAVWAAADCGGVEPRRTES